MIPDWLTLLALFLIFLWALWLTSAVEDLQRDIRKIEERLNKTDPRRS